MLPSFVSPETTPYNLASSPFLPKTATTPSSSSCSNCKSTISSLHHHHHHHHRRRRQRQWLLIIMVLVVLLLSGPYLFTTLISSSSMDFDFIVFPELAIAKQYQPTAVTAPRIPKIVHFVYGLKAPDPTLDLIHYLAIKSAHDKIQPDTIMFHYHHLPTGHLFAKARPWLTLHKVDLPTTPVFGFPIKHFAHQADIIRLAVLRQYGGIYLDLDVISMASLDHLLDQEFVMGQEGVDGSVGLCNAVMLAKPNARFLQRWQATYKTFDQTKWNYHSVLLPNKLATSHLFDDEITILDHTAFFWPLWTTPGVRTLLLEKSYDFGRNLASHTWESVSSPHLMANLSENVIRHVDNSLYCQLRYLLDDNDDQVRACRRLDHSPLPNQLVGYWPLIKPQDPVLLDISPTPATDVSGNDMHGIIRNGRFDSVNGVYVSGQDSYVFLSMPNQMTTANNGMTVQWQMKTTATKQGGVAMMIQMDSYKWMVKTTRFNRLDVEWWKDTDNGWTLAGRHHHRDDTDSASGVVFNDGAYHDFILVLDGGNQGSMVLSMDGKRMAYLDTTTTTHQVVRGLWFGSAEPVKYHQPWDTKPSLAAWYKDLRVWERAIHDG